MSNEQLNKIRLEFSGEIEQVDLEFLCSKVLYEKKLKELEAEKEADHTVITLPGFVNMYSIMSRNNDIIIRARKSKTFGDLKELNFEKLLKPRGRLIGFRGQQYIRESILLDIFKFLARWDEPSIKEMEKDIRVYYGDLLYDYSVEIEVSAHVHVLKATRPLKPEHPRNKRKRPELARMPYVQALKIVSDLRNKLGVEPLIRPDEMEILFKEVEKA